MVLLLLLLLFMGEFFIHFVYLSQLQGLLWAARERDEVSVW